MLLELALHLMQRISPTRCERHMCTFMRKRMGHRRTDAA
jgi:hypothetical protein